MKSYKWLSTLGLVLAAAVLCAPLTAQGPRASNPGTRRPRDHVPKDAGILNVKEEPFLAKGDGSTDDTTAIARAFATPPPPGAALTTVFFPPGIYRVSDQLVLPAGGIAIQGVAGRRSILRLADRTSGFGNAGSPRSVLTVPDSVLSGGPSGRFWIHHIALDVGRGNPGAVGIEVGGASLVGLRSLTVLSSDPEGAGAIGLSVTGAGTGSASITGVRISGFETGIKITGSEQNVVLHKAELSDQRLVGISNQRGLVSIRDLRSENRVPVLFNLAEPLSSSGWGTVVIVGARLDGGGSRDCAVENEAAIYLRDIATTGYRAALKDQGSVISGTNIAGEYVEQRFLSLFRSPTAALQLDTERAPRVPWSDARRWVNVERFGADGSDAIDDTTAIQAAIDGVKNTIYFPAGEYLVSGTLQLRGKARRLILFDSRITAVEPLLSSTDPVFEVLDGRSPVVILDRGELVPGLGPGVHHTGSRTLVLRSGRYGAFSGSGSGRTFIDDAHLGRVNLDGGHRLFASQVLLDTAGTKVLNEASDAWLFGVRIEKPGIAIHNRGGARSELLGGSIFPSNDLPLQQPLFLNEESGLTVVAGESAVTKDRRHEIVVQEARDRVTRRLFENEIPRRGNLGLGAQISAYSSFEVEEPGSIDGPILFYRFDEPSGNSARDSSGVGPDARLTGATFAADGVSGNCLSLDGVDDFAELPPDYLDNGEGAVSVWFRSSQRPADAAMLFYATDSVRPTANGFGSEDELHLHLTAGGEVQFFIEDDRTDVLLTSDVVVADGEWHHALASWSRGGTVELFVDGKRVAWADRTYDAFSFGGKMSLGRANSGRFFEGFLDEVIVYDRPVTHWEAMDLYFGLLPFTNYRPAADAGPDRVVQNTALQGTLVGQAADDGQPFSNLFLNWTKISGPGTVTFSDRSQIRTDAVFERAGTYELRLTADDGAASHSSDVTVNVFDALGAPWMTEDVGAPAREGWTLEDSPGDAFTLNGSGAGIGPEGGTRDGFHHVFQPLGTTVGREIVATLQPGSGTDPDARAGLMMRGGPGDSEANVFFGRTGNDRLVLQSRDTAFGNTTTLLEIPGVVGPVWLQLERTGLSKVEASYSLDGVNWSVAGAATPELGAAGSGVTVGLAVTSGREGAIYSASFTEVAVQDAVD